MCQKVSVFGNGNKRYLYLRFSEVKLYLFNSYVLSHVESNDIDWFDNDANSLAHSVNLEIETEKFRSPKASMHTPSPCVSLPKQSVLRNNRESKHEQSYRTCLKTTRGTRKCNSKSNSQIKSVNSNFETEKVNISIHNESPYVPLPSQSVFKNNRGYSYEESNRTCMKTTRDTRKSFSNINSQSKSVNSELEKEEVSSLKASMYTESPHVSLPKQSEIKNKREYKCNESSRICMKITHDTRNNSDKERVSREQPNAKQINQQDGIVTNLSSYTLSDSEKAVLSKGLKLIPDRKHVDTFKLLADLAEWERRMRLREYFTGVDDLKKHNADPTDLFKIKKKSNFTPNKGRDP